MQLLKHIIRCVANSAHRQFLRSYNWPLQIQHHQVNLPAPLLPCPLPPPYLYTYTRLHVTDTNYLFLQWRRPRKSMRVPLLQSQEQRRERRAGYGDTAGAVLGAVDGGGLFACLMCGVGWGGWLGSA